MDLQQTVTTLCYQHMAPIVQQEARRHQCRYGGDWPELLAEANYHFCNAWMEHDPNKGNFSPRLRFLLRQRLLDSTRKEARRHKLLARTDNDPNTVTAPDSGRWQRLLVDLSDEARTIVELIVGPCWEMIVHKKAKGEHKRNALRNFLAEAGWCSEEIARSFAEIMEALG